MAEEDSASEPPRALVRLRALARLLDDAVEIPILKIRVGLDPVLGLFPGAGDVVALAMAGWIVVTAARLGASASVIGRMLLNIGLDGLAGTIPVFGDVFDLTFRANRRNLQLVEEHVVDPAGTLGRSRRVVFGAVLGVLGLIAGLAAIVGWVVGVTWSFLTG